MPAQLWQGAARQRERCGKLYGREGYHTRAASRRLILYPRAEHEALAMARKQHESEQGRRLYEQRQGIEGTISQSVRSFGLRRARYRGPAKQTFQGVVTAR